LHWPPISRILPPNVHEAPEERMRRNHQTRAIAIAARRPAEDFRPALLALLLLPALLLLLISP